MSYEIHIERLTQQSTHVWYRMWNRLAQLDKFLQSNWVGRTSLVDCRLNLFDLSVCFATFPISFSFFGFRFAFVCDFFRRFSTISDFTPRNFCSSFVSLPSKSLWRRDPCEVWMSLIERVTNDKGCAKLSEPIKSCWQR